VNPFRKYVFEHARLFQSGKKLPLGGPQKYPRHPRVPASAPKASRGMPGSSPRTNPISLDALQEVQAVIAPFDIKLGNFTGGSVNAISRSGSNEVSVSVYTYGRDPMITGPDNAGDKSKLPSSYYDYQSGFRVGLPIIKNKLFFFR